MGKFEQYLAEFSKSVNFTEFLIGLLVTALLAFILRIYYIRYGNAVSNRRRFAANFLPLALTTMLIITIVKSSIALSLGLVGALSIVRFRAAIKDPEELTYLFLVIGIGLAAGANQPLIGVVAFFFILLLLYVNQRLSGKVPFKSEDKMYLNVRTDVDDLNRITDVLSAHFSYVELKRFDKVDDDLDASFIVKAGSVQEIEKGRKALAALSGKTLISFVDQPDLVV